MQTSSMGGSSLAQMLEQMQAKMKTSFSNADTDGDGKLTKTEFSAFDTAMKADAPQGVQGAGGTQATNTATADEMFSKMDKDGDGSVTLAEMQPPQMNADGMAALLQMQEADGNSTNPMQDAMLKAFKAADTDGDGALSETEFTAFDEAMKANAPQGAGSTATETTSTADSSGTAAAGGGGGGMTTAQVFDKLDTNKDGKVSAEELMAVKPSQPSTATAASGSTDDATDTGDLLSSLIQQLLSSYKQNSGDVISAMTSTSTSA